MPQWRQHLQRLKVRLDGQLRKLAAIDLSHLDWTPDLAEEIGSRRWKRGIATLLGLTVAALAFWPSMAPLEAAPALHADAATRLEYRSQMILPLAMGAPPARQLALGGLVRPASAVPERAIVRFTAVMAQGDSFSRLLQRAGVSAQDAGRASELVAAAVPLGQIEPGTRVAVTLGQRPAPDQPRLLESAELRAKLDMALTVSRTGSALALVRRAIPVDATPLRIRGTVGPSLYRSARAAGAPVSAIQQYLQALDSHINLEGDIHPGDSFDLILSYKRARSGDDSGEGQAGELLYAGLERDSQPVTELLRWGNGQFYSADALTRPVVRTTTSYGGMGGGGSFGLGSGMLWPVNGHVTSGFGMRFHPILGYTRMHAGVDFGAAWGSPIRAVADGVVSFAGRHGGHGNYVRLDHGGGLGTGYGHMSSISVWPGSRVRAGQVLGYVGSSGLSTGPHLHLEMYQGGRTVNPLGAHYAMAAPAVQTRTVVQQIDPAQLAAFKAKLARLKAIRPVSAGTFIAMASPQHIVLR